MREAILESAMGLFEERGYEEATVEEIAAGAGVSRRTFFRYYESKGDLMAGGVGDYAARLEAAIGGYPAGWGPEEVMRATVVAVARGSVEGGMARRAMGVAAASAGAREAQLSRMGELQERVAEAYGRRRRRGGAMGPAAAAALTLAALSVTFRWWFEHEGAEIGAVAERVLAEMAKVTGGGR